MSCVIEGSGRPMAREGAEPPSEIRSVCLAGADRVEQAIELAARGDRADEAVELASTRASSVSIVRCSSGTPASATRISRTDGQGFLHHGRGEDVVDDRVEDGVIRGLHRGLETVGGDARPAEGSSSSIRGSRSSTAGRFRSPGFDAIPRAFPRMPVVLAHANYRRVAEAFELVARHPGVDLDTVHVFGRVTGGWDRGDHAAAWAALREGLRAFPDRVMFGTDHPSGTGTLAAMYAEVRAFGLDPEVERLVLGGTAARLISPR